MYSKRATSSAMSLVISIIILLIVAAIILYFFTNVFDKGSKALTECTALQNGIWVGEDCNPDFSYESILIKAKIIDGVEKHCCVAKPGNEDEFDTNYRDKYKNEPENSGIENGGGSGNLPVGEGVYISMDGEVMPKMTNHFSDDIYDEGVSGIIIIPGDTLSIVGGNTFSDKSIDKCALSIRQAQRHPTDANDEGIKRIVQKRKDNDPNELDTPLKLVEFEDSEACSKVLKIDNYQFTLLSDEGLLLPFYKIDYTVWYKNNKEKMSESESTYVFLDDVELQLVILEGLVSAENNRATCYVSAYTLRDGNSEDFEGTITYNNIDLKGTSAELSSDNNKITVNFNGENPNLKVTKSFEFVDCNTVKYMYWENYLSNNGCTNVCGPQGDDYTKSQCNDKSLRQGDRCKTEFEHCYWNKAFLGGKCESCDSGVTSCDYYDNKDSCVSNQCFEKIGRRCIWDKRCKPLDVQ